MSKLKEFYRFLSNNKYATYILVILMLSYMLSQMHSYALIATNSSMAQEIEYGDKECDVNNHTAVEERIKVENLTISPEEYCLEREYICSEGEELEDFAVCAWRYTGLGTQYQLLAGPIYIILFSISSIPMGLVSELNNISLKLVLAVCAVLWSVVTVLGAFAIDYWHVAVCRLLLGTFSSACVPFSTGIISGYITAGRGAALGFFNWGVFIGYSMSYVLIFVEKAIGWRWVYIFAGVPGVIIGFLIAFTVRDPPRNVQEMTAMDQLSDTLAKLKQAARYFINPALVVLSLGGAIRMGAGYLWAYNLVPFFAEYHPDTNVEMWMSWIPLIFGSLGAFGGGYVSDKISAKRGPRWRLTMLILSCTVGALFNIGTLLLPMPWAFISHIPAYVFGEMWLGICAAVVVELVPFDITTSAMSIYYFIIMIIGGNMNALITPLTKHLSLRVALLITFPGFYLLAAFFFGFTFCMLGIQKDKQYDLTDENKQPVSDETSTATFTSITDFNDLETTKVSKVLNENEDRTIHDDSETMGLSNMRI